MAETLRRRSPSEQAAWQEGYQYGLKMGARSEPPVPGETWAETQTRRQRNLASRPESPSPDIERLRRQNHEHAERRDRENAALQAEVDRWHNAAARARGLVRGSPVDWTHVPNSQEPDRWWTYTSQINREILTAAVAELRAESPSPEGPDFLDGAVAEYRECMEVRHLLGYLWNATGKNHLRPVHDLFDEDDPIVADVERLAIFDPEPSA